MPYPKNRVLSNYRALNFKILSESAVKYNKTFKRSEKKTSFVIEHNFGEQVDLAIVKDEIEENFATIIKKNIEGENENNLITVELVHESLENPIYIGHLKIKNFKVSSIFDRLEKFSQSNKSLLADGKIDLIVCITENVRGSGPKKAPRTITEQSKSKMSVITIKNKDQSCAFRALFVSMFFSEHPDNKNECRNVRVDVMKKQTNGAQELATRCGLPFNEPVDAEEWQKIQEVLKEYQIVVVDASYKKNFIFRGPKAQKKLYIEYINEHYNSIVNIKGYMGRRYFCEECLTAYHNNTDRCCEARCQLCGINCGEEELKILCDECNREFKNQVCYDTHHKKKICKSIKKCGVCERTYWHTHICGAYFCRKCNKPYKDQPHFCYIEPMVKEKLEEDKLNKIIVAFDIESRQENGEHIPNLLVQKTQCDKCTENGCEVCDILASEVYFGDDCIKRFVTYLFDTLAKRAEEKKSHVYPIAHNARGYDAQFILRELWGRGYKDLKVIMRGRKILSLQCGNVKMLDSLNFFLQPLEKLPAALGLDISNKKGDFPHLFNRKDNYKYKGPLPGLEYFGVDYMPPNKKSKVEQWHAEYTQSEKEWNFQHELISYCTNDVDILLKCVMKFRKVFKEITDLDPFTRAITLASVGIEVFKSKFLSKETMAITPVKGYSAEKNHSKTADCWLDWLEYKNQIELTREFKIGPYWVDGYDEKNKIAYEFNGCRYHGHCVEFNQEKQDYLKKKLESLRKQHTVIDIYECEYKEQRKQDKEMKEYHNKRYLYYLKLDKYGHANIKDSFFGGRTNNLKFHQTVNADEEIKYLDVCSLYPYVLKNRKYPIGHPKVIRQNFDYSLSSYFGFVKCKVLPPRGLYLPVLPVVINKKLMFPLCCTCAKNKNRECRCQDRSMVGTWATEELKKAIEVGYLIEEIYEVLNCTDKNINDQLFKQYVDMWLKIKQEASGWPAWCQTEQDKVKYITDYKMKEEVELEYPKIEKNEALRFIAKIMLNSFWGKLAQKPNQRHVSILNNYDEYFKIAIDEKIEQIGCLMVDEDTMIITWEYKDPSDDRVKNYNIAVASYVTVYARLMLYDIMCEIERIRPGSLLYFDTDSVMFVRKFSDPQISCGDYLGELTDEIEKDYGPTARCIEFVSLGPKNYVYVVDLGNGEFAAVFKIKGIRLTHKALQTITLANMTDQTEAYLKDEIIELRVPQMQFTIDQHCRLHTRYFDKTYRAVSEKRVVGVTTVPYGYCST